MSSAIRQSLDAVQMFVRNYKVATELAPSAFKGYILREGEKFRTANMHSRHNVFFDWDYSNRGSREFQMLYDKAKKGQWDSDELAWNTSVDPYSRDVKIFPEKLLPMYDTDFYQKADRAHKDHVLHSMMAWMLSQFLHGEQGALYAAAQTVEATHWYDAKLYGSTQVMDEARHVEVFEKYLNTKLNKLYKVNDNLFVILHALTTTGDWDTKFLGMQIMIEGLALGAFRFLYQYTEEPLLRELLKRVISDEARHVHYGVVALRDYYTKQLSEKKRREREDWAFEVAHLLRNRFLFLELREEFYGNYISETGWIKMITESALMIEFRRLLFSRMIPNLKAIGLLSDRIRPRYQQLGLLEHEHGKSADQLTMKDLLSA